MQIVEHWNPFARRRIDLLGFGDLLCVSLGFPPLIVQTTSGANLAARRTKILAEPRAKMWLSGGGRIAVHGWRKLKKKRGKAATYWALRELAITLEDFG